MVHKIHKAKKQDHLGNHLAIRKVTGTSVATLWITEHLEYLFLQSSRRIQYARTKSKRLIEKLENHKHKDSFIQDLSQTQKINKFSKESQDLIADLNNTEIFELCENSSTQQCPECNTYWETGIIYCSCGRSMKSSQRPTEFEQNNYDVTSIRCYVITENSSRGAKHGPSERQRMYYQAKQILKTRSYASETYRTSLSLIGWEEKDIKKEELSNHSINDRTLLKREENANYCMTSTWQRPRKTTEPFLAVNK